jgi:small GTP-binding protein
VSATSGENRAVLLTAPGAAAIAVVRLVGPGVEAFLGKHFSRPTVAGRCVHGLLSEGEEVIDDPVVVRIDEERADVNLHGGPWVVRSVLELLGRNGFEVLPSSGGPLPADALDEAGGIEREVEAYLPLARTELAVRVLLAQPAAWERLEGDPNPEAARRVLNDLSLYRLLHPPRVAIVGPANVGKSTLANRLFAQERSIVADLPGTTRDWVGEMANINGLAAMLVDTPGLRETNDPIEQVAIERSARQVSAADLVIAVLDATRPLAGEQADLLAKHPGALVVVNKVDRGFAEGMEGVKGLRTVASTGEGVQGVMGQVCRCFGCEGMEAGVARWWAPRQREWLANHLADGG